MKLRVLHRTHYEYAAPVVASYNETRLQPISSEGQDCHSFVLRVLPATRLSHYHDFYNNIVHFFEVPDPHRSLTIESFSTVSTTARILDGEKESVPLEKISTLIEPDRCYDFLQRSTYVSIEPDVWRLALDAVENENDAWQAAQAIMRFVHAHFKYMPDSTNVNTHVSEVIQHRRGVCQDFAHVMLGMCRALKIPARYVSGYLYNGPTEHLLGSQASHAWCEVFLPGVGWCGLDPTNNRQPDEHYVRVATGRDYADVPPVKGHYRGTAERAMRVEVNVSLADA